MRSNINCDLSQLCTVLALKEGTLMKVYKAWHAREVVVKAFKSKIVVLTGGFAPLDPYQGYALHPPEVLAAPLDHQHNFEYPALPTPNQKFRIPPWGRVVVLKIFLGKHICLHVYTLYFSYPNVFSYPILFWHTLYPEVLCFVTVFSKLCILVDLSK